MPLGQELLVVINSEIREQLTLYEPGLVVGSSYSERLCHMCDKRALTPNEANNYVLACREDPRCVFTMVGIPYNPVEMYKKHLDEGGKPGEEPKINKNIIEIVDRVGKQFGVRMHTGVAFTGGLRSQKKLKEALFGPYKDFTISFHKE